MIHRTMLYIVLISLLFSSSILVLYREPIELIFLYIIWFTALYMLFSIWISIKCNTSLNLPLTKHLMVKIKFNSDFYTNVVEFFIWSILFSAIVEMFNVTLWQYLLSILLLFIIYRVLLNIPIKRVYRYIAISILFIILYFLGYFTSDTFNKLDGYFKFIEDIIYGTE